MDDWHKLEARVEAAACESERDAGELRRAIHSGGLECPAAAAAAHRARASARNLLGLFDVATAASAPRRGLPPEPGT